MRFWMRRRSSASLTAVQSSDFVLGGVAARCCFFSPDDGLCFDGRGDMFVGSVSVSEPEPCRASTIRPLVEVIEILGSGGRVACCGVVGSSTGSTRTSGSGPGCSRDSWAWERRCKDI